MLKDFLSNFLKSQEEKIKLPTFFTFLIAFLVFKIWIYWKPISIFLLSKEDIETRIIKIDNQINLIEKNFSISSWWQSILFSIFIGASFSLLSLIVGRLLYNIDNSISIFELELIDFSIKNLSFLIKMTLFVSSVYFIIFLFVRKNFK